MYVEASFRVESPAVSMSGFLSFDYPCELGDTAFGNTTLALRAGPLHIDGATAEVSYYCGVAGAAETPECPAWMDSSVRRCRLNTSG